MSTKVKKYSIIMGIITLILVSILAIQVNAEEPTTGSITIIAHEQQNGDTTTNPPLAGIEYTAKGERYHLNLDESDMNYKDLLKAMKTFGVKGVLTCESPNIETDAKLLKDYYMSLK